VVEKHRPQGMDGNIDQAGCAADEKLHHHLIIIENEAARSYVRPEMEVYDQANELFLHSRQGTKPR
jgi:hypothetical protein